MSRRGDLSNGGVSSWSLRRPNLAGLFLAGLALEPTLGTRRGV